MKEQFISKTFRAESLQRIEQANEIIVRYGRQGLKLTLRQLYYQFVSAAAIPNTERSYKNLGKLISEGRLAGLIDWEAIEDRMRQPVSPPEYENLEELVHSALYSYRLPRWATQPEYAELWVEKDALAGVLRPLARKFHVVLMVNRGYSSSSAMYESAQRFASRADDDAKILFYLGDLDPSGEDMVRDIGARLELFGVDTDVRKLALTMEQVKQYQPPPNPTKLSDSRAEGFIAKYGTESWEVDDALPPTVLTTLITDAFDEVIDREAMDEVIREEEEDKVQLREALSGLRGKE